jgi:hypothetical protein
MTTPFRMTATVPALTLFVCMKLWTVESTTASCGTGKPETGS